MMQLVSLRLLAPPSADRNMRHSLEVSGIDFKVETSLNQVNDPANAALWVDDLRWYLEAFATFQPFEKTRAATLSDQISTYGSALASTMSDAMQTHVKVDGADFILQISQEDECVSKLIHWEVLENLAMWPERRRPSGISVVHHVEYFDSSNSLMKCHPLRTVSETEHEQYLLAPKHVLVLYARPAAAQDIEHRLVTSIIMKTVERAQASTSIKHTLDICRPGSLSALKRILNERPHGYFDVVHLDVHGVLRDSVPLVELLSLQEGVITSHSVTADDLAEVLLPGGVRNVVLNACESSSSGGVASNFARRLLELGLKMCIGMRFKVTDHAVSLFTQTFYRQYLEAGIPLVQCAVAARASLLRRNDRLTPYGISVCVSDYLVPAIYHSENALAVLRRVVHDQEEEAVSSVSSDLIGRESDLLLTETYVAAGCQTLVLRGPPAVGKTKLITHVLQWWSITGFATCFYYRASQFVGNLAQFEAELDNAVSTWELERGRSSNRCVIVLDEMQCTIGHLDAGQLAKLQRVKRLVRKLRANDSICVILLSSHEIPWAENLADTLQLLGPLDRKSQIELGTKLLMEVGKNVTVDLEQFENRFYFAKCIEVSNGNSLAIQMIIQSFCSHKQSPKDFYWRLTSGQGIDIDLTPFQADEGASFIFFIQTYLEQIDKLDGWSQLENVLYLAYFVHLVPVNVLAYRWFLQDLCKRIVPLRGPLRTFPFLGPVYIPQWVLKPILESAAADLSSEFRSRLLESPWGCNFKSQHRAAENVLFDESTSAKTDESGFQIVWDDEMSAEIQRQQGHVFYGLLSPLPEAGAGFIRSHPALPASYEIHPVFSVLLKARLSCLTSDQKLVAETAYLRFQTYQLSRFNTLDLADNTWVNTIVSYTNLNFESMMTAAKMGLEHSWGYADNMTDMQDFWNEHWKLLPKHQLVVYLDFVLAALEKAELEAAKGISASWSGWSVLGRLYGWWHGKLGLAKDMLKAHEQARVVALHLALATWARRALEVSAIVFLQIDERLKGRLRVLIQRLDLTTQQFHISKFAAFGELDDQFRSTLQFAHDSIRDMIRKFDPDQPFPPVDTTASRDSGSPHSNRQEGSSTYADLSPEKALLMSVLGDDLSRYNSWTLDDYHRIEQGLLTCLPQLPTMSNYPVERIMCLSLLTRISLDRRDLVNSRDRLVQLEQELDACSQQHEELRTFADEQRQLARAFAQRVQLHEAEQLVQNEPTSKDANEAFIRTVAKLSEDGCLSSTQLSISRIVVALSKSRIDEVRTALDELEATIGPDPETQWLNVFISGFREFAQLHDLCRNTVKEMMAAPEQGRQNALDGEMQRIWTACTSLMSNALFTSLNFRVLVLFYRFFASLVKLDMSAAIQDLEAVLSHQSDPVNNHFHSSILDLRVTLSTLKANSTKFHLASQDPDKKSKLQMGYLNFWWAVLNRSDPSAKFDEKGWGNVVRETVNGIGAEIEHDAHYMTADTDAKAGLSL